MIGAPFATTKWDEIIPGLSMGGHDYQPLGMGTPLEDVVVADEFDVVVSLFRRGIRDYGPADGVEHRIAPFLDGQLDARDVAAVRALGVAVAHDVMAERRVLVRCRAGYNRSGLVVAFALLHIGYSAEEAITLIRAKRSPWALGNSHFQDYIIGADPLVIAEGTTKSGKLDISDRWYPR